jgi:photosystem II stability/assembly factor-like uncharacterized protein
VRQRLPKIVLLCVFLSCVSLSGFASNDEEGWTWQYPRPQGNTLRAVAMSPGAWIAVGDHGTIVRTSDGGLSWSFVPNSFSQHIQGVCHLGENHWLAVGREGLILGSGDDGLTWSRRQTDSRADLFGVAFATAEVGAAVGTAGTVLWSADGGLSWIARESGVKSELRAIAFLAPEKAVAVGKGGLVLKTTDSGRSWVRKDAGMDLLAVQFTDETNGYAAGGSVGYIKNRQFVVRTTDGGDTWQPELKKWGPVLYGLTSAGRDFPLACGQKGALANRGDGGWARIKSPTKHVLASLALSRGKGVAVGSYGTILRTEDGGRTWTSPLPDDEKSLNSISFSGPGYGLATGGERLVLWTVDGGKTWTNSKTVPGLYMGSACLLNAQTAVAVGAGGVIFRTSDAGATWEQIQTGVDWGFSRIIFVDESRGLAFGAAAILATEDGGRTWTRRPLPLNAGSCVLFNAAVCDKIHWLAVGMQGLIVASEDGGRTWKRQPSGTKKMLFGIAWSDPRTATAVGYGGLILQSVDGGPWTERESGTTHRLSGVGFVNPSTGFAVGEFGTILRTDDGGRTWKHENSHTLNHLYNLVCAEGGVYVVGWNSTILHLQVENPEGGGN